MCGCLACPASPFCCMFALSGLHWFWGGFLGGNMWCDPARSSPVWVSYKSCQTNGNPITVPHGKNAWTAYKPGSDCHVHMWRKNHRNWIRLAESWRGTETTLDTIYLTNMSTFLQENRRATATGSQTVSLSCAFLLNMLSSLVNQSVLEHYNADEWESVCTVLSIATWKC